jgi:predicted nucleic acid-binding protein
VNSIIVPDASVLLKWVLRIEEEEESDKALALMRLFRTGGCAIAVPDLWVYEVGNILGLKEPRLAPRLLAMLIACDFEEKSARSIYPESLAIMKKYGVTFYDASYHATALSVGGMLLTSDERYFGRAKAAGSIRPLKSWEIPGGGL